MPAHFDTGSISGPIRIGDPVNPSVQISPIRIGAQENPSVGKFYALICPFAPMDCAHGPKKMLFGV